MNKCACGCGRDCGSTYFKGHNRRRPVAERFWEKVDTGGPCWVWMGADDGKGYGRFNNGERVIGAHRWAWQWLVGDIPEGLQLDHLCRNTLCVNPDHLEPVTAQVNLARGYGAPAQRHRKRAL